MSVSKGLTQAAPRTEREMGTGLAPANRGDLAP